jgi:hypothetical protein
VWQCLAVARKVEHIEFTPMVTGEVVAKMDELGAARDGWINLLPGVPEEFTSEQPRPSPLSGLFGPKNPDVVMITFMPAEPSGRGRARDRETFGFMHAVGHKVVPALRQEGLVIPEGWWLRQDHVRRGLIVELPVGEDHTDALAWALRVGGALCVAPMTGSWRADVYLPGRI